MPTKTKATTKKTPSKRKNVSASSAAALATKMNAERTAQPGIIAEIVNALMTAKKNKTMLTVDEIATHLKTVFPDREITGMMTTVRAQLHRLPLERAFEIKKQRDGRVVRYAAA